jgi:hypothetical protein
MNEHVNEFDNIKCVVKNARHNPVRTALFYFCNVLKQAKVLCSVQNQNANPVYGGTRRVLKVLVMLVLSSSWCCNVEVN